MYFADFAWTALVELCLLTNWTLLIDTKSVEEQKSLKTAKNDKKSQIYLHISAENCIFVP